MDDKFVVLDGRILGATDFATKIVDMVLENDIDFTDVFNGLNIASATFLMDYCSDEQGVNREALHQAYSRLVGGLNNAVVFALNNIDAKKESSSGIIVGE